MAKIKLIQVDDDITIIYKGVNYVIQNNNNEKLFQIVSLINQGKENQFLIAMFEKYILEEVFIDSHKYVKKNKVNKLKKFKAFVVKDDKVYLKGTKSALPEQFLEEVLKAKDDVEISALINFMYNLQDNPFEDVRNKFFDYIKGNRLQLTPNGLVVMYRKVNKTNDFDITLKSFISLSYLKIKTQKKSPKNYLVGVNAGEYKLFKDDDIIKDKNWIHCGNLAELYAEKDVFTDNHTGKMRIELGKEITLPIEECDVSNATCSSGLHLSTYSWFKDNSFGNVGVMCLVNPSNIVAIPLDNYPKIRCSAYYPVAIVDNLTIEEIEKLDTKVWDLDYSVINFQEIFKKITNQNNSFTEKKKEEIVKTLSKVITPEWVTKTLQTRIIKN